MHHGRCNRQLDTGLVTSGHASTAPKKGQGAIQDMDLIDRNLPPLRLKRAECEAARQMRSKPVDAN
jgi:hypothetical protein